MSNVLQLNSHDLGRVRLSLQPDPLWELQGAAHWPLDVDDPARGRWARRSAEQLGHRGGHILRLLRTPIVQIADLGHYPDAEGTTFEFALEGVLSQSTSRWRTIADRLHGNGYQAGASLLDDGSRFVEVLGDAMQSFHRAALGPYWPAIASAAAASTGRWVQVLMSGGVDALLQNLHPDISWNPPLLTVAQTVPCGPWCCHHRQHPRRRVSPRGLVIIPSVVNRNCSVNFDYAPDAPEATCVVVPVGHPRSTFEPLDAPNRSALADLLGSARAWVLAACAEEELTTSGVARVVGVSVSSASEHTTVLRAAGLIESHRVGNRMLHRATSFGALLLRTSTR
jgi:DNA-binding transcriptional ArsR family regulator